MISLWIDKEGRQMSEADIRASNPLTVFPHPFVPVEGYKPVFDDDAPLHDALTHELRWGEPQPDGDGVWRRACAVVPLPDDVAAANLEARRLSRVPQVVSRAQLKLALIRAGLWPRLLECVAGIADDDERAAAEVALHDATEYRRDSPFVARCAECLGLSERQLDDLFTLASMVTL